MQLFCGVVCGDDDHHKFFQLRVKIKRMVGTFNILRTTRKMKRKRDAISLDIGAVAELLHVDIFAAGFLLAVVDLVSAFTEPCILTLRKNDGKPETMPYDAYSIKDY